jgi:excisionase family DNA binding protein
MSQAILGLTKNDLAEVVNQAVGKLVVRIDALQEEVQGLRKAKTGYKKPPFISPKQFADVIGVDKSTVIRWCKIGALRGTQPGGEGTLWLIPREEIERLYHEALNIVPEPLPLNQGGRA